MALFCLVSALGFQLNGAWTTPRLPAMPRRSADRTPVALCAPRILLSLLPGAPRAASLTNAPVMSMASGARSVASGAAAAALALALSSGNFEMAPPRALAAPPAVVRTNPAG